MQHEQLTEKIINAFYHVFNTLGYGFLEKVYENSMIIELRKIGLQAEQQVPISVYYDAQDVGDYFADIVVNNLVIIEIKAADALVQENHNQLINYLKATDKEVGLLLNFGKSAEIKRAIFSNEKKPVLLKQLSLAKGEPLEQSKQ
jgi:GxxExxY protein